MKQLSLLEPPPPNGTVAVWNVLDDEKKAEVVATLARLIAKAATSTDADQEQDNE